MKIAFWKRRKELEERVRQLEEQNITRICEIERLYKHFNMLVFRVDLAQKNLSALAHAGQSEEFTPDDLQHVSYSEAECGREK